MPIKLGFLRRKPKIVDMRPGDVSRLQAEQEHQRRVAESKKKGGLLRRAKAERQFGQAGAQMGRGISQFGQMMLRQPEPFTQEQEALSQMFGGGEKIWGWKNEPVEINNDLHPSLSGYDETASIFGFGRRN